jgi:hypothetical protein
MLRVVNGQILIESRGSQAPDHPNHNAPPIRERETGKRREIELYKSCTWVREKHCTDRAKGEGRGGRERDKAKRAKRKDRGGGGRICTFSSSPSLLSSYFDSMV